MFKKQKNRVNAIKKKKTYFLLTVVYTLDWKKVELYLMCFKEFKMTSLNLREQWAL